MRFNESAEMYLETIYVLSKGKPIVRSIDVAESLGYSKPSVSRAVSLLKKSGHLEMLPDGALVLTDSGFELAKKIYERHDILTRCLMQIGVDEKAASEDACKVEHVISDETFEAIKKFISQS